MTVGGLATRDSHFTPSVTYCVRRKSTKWAQVADETRWIEIANRGTGAEHYVSLAVSRTKSGADEQAHSWANLLGLDTQAATTSAVTFAWLWAGSSSCVVTVTVTQHGALTAIHIYPYAYNAEYEWPEHVGRDGLRTHILDLLDQFDLGANYSDLPRHIIVRLENSVQSRTSALIAEVGNTAVGDPGHEPNDGRTSLQSIWRLRTALRNVIAGLHEHQPESTVATEALTHAVSEIDTLLGALNTQQLLNQTIADARAREDQARRDEADARRDKVDADRESRHDRTLALIATLFIGPSLVFAFFSLPSSPQWETRALLMWAGASIIVVRLTIWLFLASRREPEPNNSEG